MIKLVLFDIGGVVVGSPISGAQRHAQSLGLPSQYINCAITARGPQGAFQRLERGEWDGQTPESFYEQFGKEMSDTQAANEAYRRFCERTGSECPVLPDKLLVDGKELWQEMMRDASTLDPVIVSAILRLRTSGKVKVAALTNNFVLPGSTSPYSSAKSSLAPAPSDMSVPELQGRMWAAHANEPGAGPAELVLADLFGGAKHIIGSAQEGLRKPDERFFKLALERMSGQGGGEDSIEAHETVFLDDIGLNLVAARKLGMHTIRVYPGRSEEAVRELESVTGVQLLDEQRRETKL